MRLTRKAVNAELARRGHQVLLEKGSGYFYFRTGEAADWLDRTVPVAKISALSLDEWVDKFRELKRVNEEIRRVGSPRPTVSARTARPGGRLPER
jgi:hypothetical protein